MLINSLLILSSPESLFLRVKEKEGEKIKSHPQHTPTQQISNVRPNLLKLVCCLIAENRPRLKLRDGKDRQR